MVNDQDKLLVNAAPFATTGELGGSMSSGAPADPEVGGVSGILRASSHPGVLIFHLLFRTLALATYILGSFFSSSFILLFVVTTLLLAFDFWTVKNVSGRLLVGLRWWNEIRDDGSNVWVFESKPDRSVNPIDSRIFWTTLYVFPLLWVFFGFVALVKFSFGWLLLCSIAVALNVSNTVSYYRCEQDAKARYSTFMGANNGFLGSMVSGIVGSRIGSLFGGSR
ncbi:hypothetical protein DFJ74DRAFT_686192 [Hyaloraphidium curvatum]|nr:hypothetical protein DFJ74DRAFT_686192 [Hyaloraphidium curvatum]